MNAVMIVPTGIGAEIGGHAGDATPSARLLASVCDKLLIHPNIVNASNIIDMPENCWYVEGSMLDRFLNRDIDLFKPLSNKILVAVNPSVDTYTINTVSACRAVSGINAEIVKLKTPLIMKAKYVNKVATGDIFGVDELINQVKDMEFDALAIATFVDVPFNVASDYAEKRVLVNPWGGVEAKLSKYVSQMLGKPVAHAPAGTVLKNYEKIIDPRMSAEIISHSYLYSVIKGLHKAPRIAGNESSNNRLTASDISCVVSPMCYGTPHEACMELNIPIIFVEENKTVDVINLPGIMIYNKTIVVSNYLEAVGAMVAIKEGMTLESIRRPLNLTKIM